jgi:hypothetical protein
VVFVTALKTPSLLLACSHSGDNGCTERAKAIFAGAMAESAV